LECIFFFDGAATVDYTGAVATVSSANSEEKMGNGKAGAGARDERTPGRGIAFLWIATATLTGAIVMAMELTAFRLYAPYFGNSIYVWGSMISVVMLALSVGYALGGWAADRWPSDAVLYFVVLGSGLYQLGIVFVWRAVLMKVYLSGEFVGPVMATTIIFVPPMTALAMTSPFVIRLLARAGHVGITVGKVFALSTAGSIAGVLGTSFWLVPRFGTRVTLEILCAASMAIGAGGLMMRRRVAVLLVLPAGLVLAAKAPQAPARVLYTGESVYNRIRVEDYDGFRILALNDPHTFQTIQKLGSESSGYYLDEFALGPVIVAAKNLLVLGMGAGRSIEVSRVVAPELEVDAVEIDPEVVRVAREYFGLPGNDAKLHVHIADARPWLATHAEKWDLVHVDLFQGGPYVPFYLTTVEFFELVRSRMADGGVLMVNVLDKSASKELLQAMGATMARVFPSVEVLTTEKGNNIVFAFARKRTVDETVTRLKEGGGPEWVRTLANEAAMGMTEFEARPGATIFTDDRAPIEEMTRKMLASANEK
jgi:spermidine synthase